ncbi:hypothetical protein CANINC_002812 [Pichia inconspicua]|uniref:RING-type domain-containing protein n=1 Tax=Pichia inconspicua TaxID=52247 RepID=A0A4T0X0A5_9ASCO|nr:hypothetical protein CANINC_002812 [[Candida] inconspicua]
MGNTVGKENSFANSGFSSTTNRSASNDLDSLTRELIFGSNGSTNEYILGKNTKDKEIEKIKLRTKHMLDLVVRMTENIDGGYFAPHGNYRYELEYNTDIVRRFISSRQLSPFFTPLQDFHLNWNDDELLNYLKENLTLHVEITKDDLIDSIEDPNEHKLHLSHKSIKRRESKIRKLKLKEKTAELQIIENNKFKKNLKLPLDDSKRDENTPNDELLLKIYKNSDECPICFLYYPRKLNKTLCCGQSICTECFVQLKRADPHFPHDDPENDSNQNNDPEKLISEAVRCPFCATETFSVIYTPEPGFRVGLNSNIKPNEYKDKESFENIDSVKSIPIGVDDIRPDWEQKLFIARSRMARRSAAATVMHATSLLTGDSIEDELIQSNTGQGRRSQRDTRSSRTQAEQLEQLMIEETIRLSLLDEEERQRRERERERGRKK